MSEMRFVPYNDETHRDKFFELNLEYLTGANKRAYQRKLIS